MFIGCKYTTVFKDLCAVFTSLFRLFLERSLKIVLRSFQNNFLRSYFLKVTRHMNGPSEIDSKKI